MTTRLKESHRPESLTGEETSRGEAGAAMDCREEEEKPSREAGKVTPEGIRGEVCIDDLTQKPLTLAQWREALDC